MNAIKSDKPTICSQPQISLGRLSHSMDRPRRAFLGSPTRVLDLVDLTVAIDGK
jgi:hypothetical protein